MPVSVPLRLPDEVAKVLENLAGATRRPKTYFILKALEAYLAEYADDQVALDRFRDKDDPLISSTQLRRRLAR